MYKSHEPSDMSGIRKTNAAFCEHTHSVRVSCGPSLLRAGQAGAEPAVLSPAPSQDPGTQGPEAQVLSPNGKRSHKEPLQFISRAS